jgi:hypothetical protein
MLVKTKMQRNSTYFNSRIPEHESVFVAERLRRIITVPPLAVADRPDLQLLVTTIVVEAT